MKLIDLTGKRFGRLVVVQRTENSKRGESNWFCKCDCGGTKIVKGNHLREGSTKSCGCLEKENRLEVNKKHGGRYERLYSVWLGIRKRCFNVNEPAYHNYGGRGITVCHEWNDYETFREWALKSGYDENAPRGKCTLDRIDVNGNYEPSNCRWVDMKVQRQNQRHKPSQTSVPHEINPHEYKPVYQPMVGIDWEV